MNLLYLGLLLFVTLLTTLYLASTKAIFAFSDWTFHASRVEEIYLNLKSGSFFTFIAARTFHNTGAASFLFYPYIFFYPWAFLRFVLSPVNAFYAWYALVTFATAAISYFSMKSYSKKSLASFIFSLVYTFAPYRLYLGGAVFGEYLAVTFLPLLFLGIYEVLWGDKKKWYLLAIGGALVAYAHILSVFLSLEFAVILFIIKLITSRGISKDRIKSLLLAAGVCVLLVLPVIVPFFTDFIGQGLSSAKPGISYTMEPLYLLLNSFSAQKGWKLSFMLMLTIFTAWAFIKSRRNWIIYGLGLFACFLATRYFPWKLTAGTPFEMFQLTARYLSYASLFLTILFALGSDDVLEEHVAGRKKLTLSCSLAVFMALFSLSSLSVYQDTLKHVQDMPKITANSTQPAPFKRLRNYNYYNQFNYKILFGAFDYMPKSSLTSLQKQNSLLMHQAYLNGKTLTLSPLIKANQITYQVKSEKAADVDLPVIAYKHTTVSVNGQKHAFHRGNRGTVVVGLKRGQNTITVGYKASPVFYLSIVISIFSWLALLIYLVKFRTK
ncbi:hypothetical protein [uncultured Lactobacillus sp.]|uniref:hypothetical protein n=1 Tax=uncultured Lactobacillus sp. TaxID=153152 RepID=UPI0025F28655|nr:hypothetical protein [uncultured Lactobacillus sp.]